MAKLNAFEQPNYPIQIYDEMFISEQAITSAGTTVGTIEIEAGKNAGATEVAIVAAGAVLVKAAGKLGLIVKAANDKGGTYATVVTEDVVAPTSDTTYKDGEFIGVVSVPSTANPIWKADLVVTGAANTGKVSVVPYYLPR